MEKENLVWMPYSEYVLWKQMELKAISEMFPTLKGFLWDIEEKINLDNSETNSIFAT